MSQLAPMTRRSVLRLFGVGGGTIIVPLLVLWQGYEQREATGTSLAAIIVIGSLAAAVQGVYGNVDLWKGLLIGLPAIGGVMTGTAVQQRISERAVAFAFVVLLVASAAVLIFHHTEAYQVPSKVMWPGAALHAVNTSCLVLVLRAATSRFKAQRLCPLSACASVSPSTGIFGNIMALK